MKKISTIIVTLGIAAASLSSCSRSNYAFTPAQAGSEKMQQTPAVAATTPEVKYAERTSLYEAATVVAPRPAAAPVAPVATATAQPVAAAPAVVTAPVAVASNKVAATTAKPSLMQRVVLKSLTNKIDKMRQKQATASTQQTAASKKGTAALIALAGLLLAIIGIIIAGGSLSGGSGAGVAVGVVLYYIGLIAFIVGIVLLVIHLVNGD